MCEVRIEGNYLSLKSSKMLLDMYSAHRLALITPEMTAGGPPCIFLLLTYSSN